jgi:hypothetical protein
MSFPGNREAPYRAGIIAIIFKIDIVLVGSKIIELCGLATGGFFIS